MPNGAGEGSGRSLPAHNCLRSARFRDIRFLRVPSSAVDPPQANPRTLGSRLSEVTITGLCGYRVLSLRQSSVRQGTMPSKHSERAIPWSPRGSVQSRENEGQHSPFRDQDHYTLREQGNTMHLEQEMLRSCAVVIGLLLAPLDDGPLRADELSTRPAARLVTVQKIWDIAPHNAFTDLVHYQNRWWCTFREGQSHVSPDGSLRVIESTNGHQWQSAARITSDKADLRDPKFSFTPDGRLMLTAVAAWHTPDPHTHQTLAWFSDDGHDWGDPTPIGDPGVWLWRVSWNGPVAYSFGYSCGTERFLQLYHSRDGKMFESCGERLLIDGYPNETSLLFRTDGRAACLLRRDGESATGMLGTSTAPYTTWHWRELGCRLGGPHWIHLPDDRYVAAVRLYDDNVRTALCWVDLNKAEVHEFLTLPSSGDTSYAGLVWHEDDLWVSYYSSHEGKASIYLAQVKLP